MVFPAAAALIVLFVVVTAMFPRHALATFEKLQGGIADNFSWLYIAAMSMFLLFAIYLIFSKYGDIKLGTDDQEPEFPRITWFAMLFSAGMGIGMLFFGVAEPMWHYLSPPDGEGGTLGAASTSMGTTLFHWCLHPWSLYALVALALAYFGFRRGLPLSFRSVFYPFLGKRIYGRLGDAIDILAILATLFGLATSLGLGAQQVNAGLYYVFGLEQGTGIQVLIIVCITSMAVASLISGLDKGIRRLSELNMCLAGFLLIFLFVMGPSVYLLKSVVQNIGEYLQQLPTNAFRTAVYSDQGQQSWLSGWTIFYWGWWIAWCPFVGMFIARVSKGRTIREFLAGVLLVPSLVAIVWMTGFGNTAIHQEIYERVSDDPDAVREKYNYAPRSMPVQVIDEDTGLPMTKDGEWLLAPDAKGAESPRSVQVKTAGGNAKGDFETLDGVSVKYGDHGVLRDTETGSPYAFTDETLYHGKFKFTEEELTLGGYLSKPILTEKHDKTVDTTATAMFFMLEAYPLATITALIATLSVVLFFVTSSDSASLVADIIASGGSEEPTTGTRLFWGILEGALASVLLLAGGLKALQTGAITIGLPFAVVVILMCVCLAIGLSREFHGKIPDNQKAFAAGETDSLEAHDAAEDK